MSERHLIPTEEAFAEYVRNTFGPGSVLHPANRRTLCGKPMSFQRGDTTFRRGVTCKSCKKADQHTDCARRHESGYIRYDCGIDIREGTPDAYAEHVRQWRAEA